MLAWRIITMTGPGRLGRHPRPRTEAGTPRRSVLNRVEDHHRWNAQVSSTVDGHLPARPHRARSAQPSRRSEEHPTEHRQPGQCPVVPSSHEIGDAGQPQDHRREEVTTRKSASTVGTVRSRGATRSGGISLGSTSSDCPTSCSSLSELAGVYDIDRVDSSPCAISLSRHREPMPSHEAVLRRFMPDRILLFTVPSGSPRNSATCR